jgi:hypothetical protein
VLRARPFALAALAIGCAAPAELGTASRPEPSQPFASARSSEVLRVAVVSDLNGSYGSRVYCDAVHSAVDRLVELSPDLVLSTGDMVAGQRRGLDYDGMWTSFHGAISDRLRGSGIPFAVSAGNHDASAYPGFEGERATFVREWSARRPDVEFADASGYPLRYSFRAGSAFFVALDSTTVGPLSDEQMTWLDRQLAEHASAPVKIVFGHVPLYPFARGRETEHIGDPELEDLLARRNVDLFLSGHHHAYYPGRRGALRLVSTACLGGGARPLLGRESASERSILLFEIAGGEVRELDAYGGDEFDRRIERAELPDHVGHGLLRIERDDVMPVTTLR